MKHFCIIDYWNGDSEAFDTLTEAVREAKRRAENARMTREEHARLCADGDNRLYICGYRYRKSDGEIVASIEITAAMCRFESKKERRQRNGRKSL